MGIAVEFCPDLALRKHGTPGRIAKECLPQKLIPNCVYEFVKCGQRNYFLKDIIPLRETKGNGVLSKPHAGVMVLEATHYLHQGEVWTKGSYKVIETYDPNDGTIHFDGLEKIV